MTFEYNDGLRDAGRRPRLYLAKGGEVVKFAGVNIPSFCAIAAQKFQKNGKWSNTTYQLQLAPGVRPLHFLSPMHGIWGEDLENWGSVAEKLALPLDVVQALIRGEYKTTAERLDKVEEFALAVEKMGATTETVIVAFGSPNNRAIREGYWELPKSSRASDGRTVTVSQGTMSDEEADRKSRKWGETCGHSADSVEVAEVRTHMKSRVGWDQPTVVEPEGARIISSRHSPGMHGGHWTIKVIVPMKS